MSDAFAGAREEQPLSPVRELSAFERLPHSERAGTGTGAGDRDGGRLQQLQGSRSVDPGPASPEREAVASRWAGQDGRVRDADEKSLVGCFSKEGCRRLQGASAIHWCVPGADSGGSQAGEVECTRPLGSQSGAGLSGQSTATTKGHWSQDRDAAANCCTAPHQN